MTVHAFAHHRTTERRLAHKRVATRCYRRLTRHAFAHHRTTHRPLAHQREVPS